MKCSSEEERLIKNLFKGYNKLIRPVRNSSDHVVITMDLVLLQLINVYEKDQEMKTNVWINLKWRDYQFDWQKKDYKVGSVRVPPDRVWTPDIVLFNNADGNYEASYKPNILLYGDEPGANVMWIPPAIYKSSCTIDVRYFPFDEQVCDMRFGSWTFDAQQVILKLDKPLVNLEDYLPSGTWDVIAVPGFERYSNETNRMELVYQFRIRRKTLFYTVNLIIPTVLISFLSIFVFYLPTDEGEKMTLCISILLALVVFLLLVSKILPPTSMVIPLISKYLIFTLMMNIVTILNTVIIINWNYRTPRTHTMPKWVKSVFVEFLPKVLFMTRPKKNEQNQKLTPESRVNSQNIESQNHNLMKTSALIEKFNRSSQSPPPPPPTLRQAGSVLTAKKLSKNTNFDSTDLLGINLNFNRSDLILAAETEQLQADLSYQSSSNLTTPASKRKNFSVHNSNSNLDLNIQPRAKHLQHKQLDKFQYNTTTTNTTSSRGKSKKSSVLYVASRGDDKNPETNFNLVASINNVKTSQGSQNYQHRIAATTATSKHNNTSNNQLNRTLILRNRRERLNRQTIKSRSLECAYDEQDQDDDDDDNDNNSSSNNNTRQFEFSSEIIEAADKVTYITNHIKSENDYEEMRDDWKYVALVIDRIMLYIFFSVTVIGTALILFDAPHIFEFVDQQSYLDKLIAANKF